jgi:streptogramin lyase
MYRLLLNWLIRGSFHHLSRQPQRCQSLARSGRFPRLVIESLEERYLLSGGMSDFRIPTAERGPYGITPGLDGNVWFTERPSFSPNHIGQITPTGNVRLCPIPTANSRAENITADSEGNLWFTDYGTNSVGRVTPTCDFAQPFPIPTAGSTPEGITAGPDGNVWFTEYYGHKVGRITPAGVITEFTTPTPNSSPSYITVGPDGNLWFTEAAGNKIGRITPFGSNEDIQHSIREFMLPTPNRGPDGITLGPDGNLWFTEHATNNIGRITPFGSDEEIQQSIQEFPVPASFDHLYSVTAGPDGNLWFVGFSDTSRVIGQMTPNGLVTTFQAPADSAPLAEITVGPDGNLWFTEYGANKIVYVLTATGTTLQATAGQPLDAVVATFHDNEPGMLGSNYQVDINWGDGTSHGQAWTVDGQGHWVATGSHTYAVADTYTVTVTITDTHAAIGMMASVTSTVTVSGGPTTPGSVGGFREVVAALEAMSSYPVLPNAPASVDLVSRDDVPPPVVEAFGQRSSVANVDPVTARAAETLAENTALAEARHLFERIDPSIINLLAVAQLG